MEDQNPLPRITIQFCTQCKWMLRAAYFAQELLSTFSTSLGEVALQPSTGGTFKVHLYHLPITGSDGEPATLQKHLLWDRKAEGGFPETKELKRRVRDVIDPSRNLGHVDGHKTLPESNAATEPTADTTQATAPSAAPQTQTAPIPRAINRLQAGNEGPTAERKFTPMDLDFSSRPSSRKASEANIGGAGSFKHGGNGEVCEDCG
ncbi:seleno protein W family protein [Halenospora varia]|nr:seleno protein W family protein [Halenospora varia]